MTLTQISLASLFLGHSQSVQTQIRHHRRLIRVFTVCLHEFLSKIKMKTIHLDTPKIGDGLIQWIGMDGTTRQI